MELVTVTIILSTVGWLANAILSKLVEKSWEKFAKKVGIKNETESLKVELRMLIKDTQSFKSSTDNKIDMPNLKEIQRRAFNTAESLRKLESVQCQTELLITNYGEHDKVMNGYRSWNKTCPERFMTNLEKISKAHPGISSSERPRSSLELMRSKRSQLVSDSAGAELKLYLTDMSSMLTASTKVLKQHIEYWNDETTLHRVQYKQCDSAIQEFQPKPPMFQSTSTRIELLRSISAQTQLPRFTSEQTRQPYSSNRRTRQLGSTNRQTQQHVSTLAQTDQFASTLVLTQQLGSTNTEPRRLDSTLAQNQQLGSTSTCTQQFGSTWLQTRYGSTEAQIQRLSSTGAHSQGSGSTRMQREVPTSTRSQTQWPNLFSMKTEWSDSTSTQTRCLSSTSMEAQCLDSTTNSTVQRGLLESSKAQPELLGSARTKTDLLSKQSLISKTSRTLESTRAQSGRSNSTR